jgi:hypothetical protein
MRFSLLAAAIGLVGGVNCALAEPDPQAQKPYQLKVVFHVANHPLLTPIFKEQVERELRDSIQAALGDLAFVSVVQDHPLLKTVETIGLRRALNNWKEASEAKTHFVLIDFVNGRYEIQARQFDGLTGLSSPIVRTDSTADRPLVARTAALLVEADFGVVGTITKINGEDVAVRLWGGGLSTQEPLARKNDVFAVAQIRQDGAGVRLDSSLLQATEDAQAGICRCRLYDRYKKEPRVGNRCLKLGTTEAPLRFRIVAADNGTPLVGLVKVRAPGAQSQSSETLSTKGDGTTDWTKRPYRNMVIAQVFKGAQPVTPDVPIEIVDNRPITIEVRPQAGSDALGELLIRRNRWLNDVYEASDIVDTLVREINEKYKQNPEDALAKAQAGLRRVEKMISNLGDDVEGLRREAEKLLGGTKLELADGEQTLRDLGTRRDEFKRYVNELIKTIQTENDPKRKKWKEMAVQAGLLEAEAKFGEAIQIYEKIREEGGEDTELREHSNKLKEQWKVKDAKHQKARDFIYQTWLKLSKAAEMRAELPQARESFEICRSADDRLTPQMLRKANLVLTARLKKELDELNKLSEDDQQVLKTIEAVSVELKKLDDEAKAFLIRTKPKENE